MTGYSNIRAAVLTLALLPAAAHAAVEISAKPTSNMTCSAGVCVPTAKKAILNVSDLANMLAQGDVTIKSDGVTQDIEVNAQVTWANTSRLTFDSHRSISFSEAVKIMSTGAVTIMTNDGGAGGDFWFSGGGRMAFTDYRSSLIINGHLYTLVRTLDDFRKSVRRTGGTGLFAQQTDWVLRGGFAKVPIPQEFQGTFEGLGNKTTGLTINNASDGDVGLFEAIGLQGTVRDMKLDAARIQIGEGSEQSVGTLAGASGGHIANCTSAGQVLIAGSASAAGGLVGLNAGSITRSGSTVTVSGGSADEVGGLVGLNMFGDGLVGKIDRSYATGSVTGSDNGSVGGLIGENLAGSVSNSYALGSVSGGNAALVGGLIGDNEDNTQFPRAPALSASYSTGSASAGSGASMGGLIGHDVADSQNANVYWDLDTSGVGNPSQGAGNVANDAGITGLTDTQLKAGLPSGFDKKVWAEAATVNNGLPYLLTMPPK